MLAMAIGVAAVVVLTALGDGARRYVVNEFSSIGTNLVIVLPGRTQTGGFSPANVITSTPRDLTVEDARALRRAPAVAPSGAGRGRHVGTQRRAAACARCMVVGTDAELLAVRRFRMAQGRFLPDEDWDARLAGDRARRQGARANCSAARRALGQFVRIGDRRFRVIGVLAARPAAGSA